MEVRRNGTQGILFVYKLILFIGLFITGTGFIQTRTNGGTAVSWGSGAVLTFRANTVNRSGLPDNLLLNVFSTSLNRWKQAAFGGFDFVYYQGTDTGTYPNYSGSTKDNSIFFTSNAGSNESLGCGTVALTQVWYNNNSGQAFKADLRFNDKCFQFTNTPGDTQSQTRIYLADVATHEIGHALGLDHSQTLQSSMVYTAANEEAVPSCDDHSAMIANYAPGDKRAQTGSINGQVITSSGAGITGAYVEAVSLERGTVISSAITSASGTFTIQGLEAGNYTILTSPFAPGPQVLSQFYNNLNTAVCNGIAFQKTFATQNNQTAFFNVNAGNTASAGTIVAQCSPLNSRFSGAENSANSAPSINLPGVAQSVFSGSNTHYYKLDNVSGELEIHALAYTLYSRADVTVDLLDLSGRRISNQTSYGNSYTGFTGYTNYDAYVKASLSTPQTVLVRVQQNASLDSGHFPSGNLGVDNAPFYLLTVARPMTAGIYANNVRCAETDNFNQYVVSGDPGSMPASATTNSNKQTGGCGMIRSANQGSPPSSQDQLYMLANSLLLIASIFIGYRARKSHF